MLAQSGQKSSFGSYIQDEDWVAEQKLDGKRILIQVEDGEVTPYNRNGDQTTLNATIREPFAGLTGNWCFDGEELDGKFWIFDMPYALDIVSPDDAYADRRTALETVFNTAWADDDRLRLVEVARTEAQKRTLFEWCMSHEAEGVMFKSLEARYSPGKRSHGMMKAKFKETADCVIMEVSPEGKSSCKIGLFVPGDTLPTHVGSVKMSAKALALAKLGAVIEVEYLYFTNDQRLYQAQFKGHRDDKDPHDCLLDDNLRRVNKTVREKNRKQV